MKPDPLPSEVIDAVRLYLGMPPYSEKQSQYLDSDYLQSLYLTYKRHHIDMSFRLLQSEREELAAFTRKGKR